MWYRYRHGPRGMRYFWFLFIPLFFFAGRGGFLGIFIWIAAIIILNLIGRAIFMAIASRSNAQNSWYQPRYQQPYQQNQYQQPYQSYQQGYQQPYYPPRPETYQTEQQYQAPQQQYDQYEQPQAEYPQELPPMEQSR